LGNLNGHIVGLTVYSDRFPAVAGDLPRLAPKANSLRVVLRGADWREVFGCKELKQFDKLSFGHRRLIGPDVIEALVHCRHLRAVRWLHISSLRIGSHGADGGVKVEREEVGAAE
jgi:hypothetical protein